MKGESVITAEQIGQAARHDPQLRVPVRPRVRRGLVVTVGAGEVIVEGGPKRQLFRGRSATELLPRLLELSDGQRDHAALAAELGVPEEIVFKSLSLLWTCGVVEEGTPEGPPVRHPRGRALPAGGLHRREPGVGAGGRAFAGRARRGVRRSGAHPDAPG